MIGDSSSLTMILALLIALLLHRSVHYLFLHPFHSVPGPWLNRVSELPAAFHLVAGRQHLYYRALHDRYGPVVRVSPDELSFVSVEAREEIYGHRKAGLMEKSPIFLGAVGKVNGSTGVSLALDAQHTRQRRALGYIFTNSALLQHEQILARHVRKLVAVAKTAAAKDEPLDVSKWCMYSDYTICLSLRKMLIMSEVTYLLFDIMGDLCFAEPFGCLDQASATDWSASIINVFVAATWTQGIRRISGVGTWLESVLLKLLIPAKAAGWKDLHLKNSTDKTLRRLAEPDRDHKDFMHQILNSESKTQLSETEVVLNMALFMSAGTDTTATALTGWTYFVTTHPAVYTRLVDEVRTALASADEITWQNVRHLRFLEATINEALRLFPPSGASQQRMVPAGGAVIDGIAVPAGKTVAVAPWASTRSRRNFVDPDAFRPERWLGEDPVFSGDRLGASVPFGNGPRVCVGRNLAYMELRLVAAQLLWHFELRLERSARNEAWGLDGRMRPQKVFHSTTKPGLWVRFRDARPAE